MVDDADFLARTPLFSRLSKEKLTGLAGRVHRHFFVEGDEIIREGDTDRRLFIIVSGSVEVIKGRGERNQRKLATFGPLDYFGEMTLIDEMVRSATVVAKEATEALSLDQSDFLAEIDQNPSIAVELLRELSRRIRALEAIAMSSLGGLLPICLHCKNIRDESGAWVRIEDYIIDRSEVDFTHGMCPDCMRKLYPKHFK
jgi:CRP-like cAMP-binding protein